MNTQNSIEIGNRLIALRKKMGYNTPKSFAAFLGINYTTYRNYEAGKYLKRERIAEISQKCGVSPEYLEYGVENINEETATPDPMIVDEGDALKALHEIFQSKNKQVIQAIYANLMQFREVIKKAHDIEQLKRRIEFLERARGPGGESSHPQGGKVAVKKGNVG